MPEATETTIAKQELRATTRARRASLSPSQRKKRDSAIQEHLLDMLAQFPAGATVAAYCPSGTEPGGASLPDVLHHAGFRVLLPRVLQSSATPAMEWVYYTGELQQGPWGLSEPSGVAESFFPEDAVALLIVPALGVDVHGHRLGQGGGFYDREFAEKQQSIPKCAIVDSEEFHSSIPHAHHDLTVNIVISERGHHRPASHSH